MHYLSVMQSIHVVKGEYLFFSHFIGVADSPTPSLPTLRKLPTLCLTLVSLSHPVPGLPAL